MSSVVLALVLGAPLAATSRPDFSEHNLYAIATYQTISFSGEKISYWIERRGVKVAELADYQIYDRGRKLKLVSKLGFSFDNIPYQQSKERFFNEAICCFVDAEQTLPLTAQCLRQNGFHVRPINTVKLRFPGNAEINPQSGHTRFWGKNALSPDGKTKGIWVVGLTLLAGGDTAYITWGPGKHNHNIAAHEYIHMCGYGTSYHDKEVFKCAEKVLLRQ
jgi:hypothetical protein